MSSRPPSTPNATGICFKMIVMPIAASIPLMTDGGHERGEAAGAEHAEQDLQHAGDDHRREERIEAAEALHFDQHDGGEAGGRAVTDSGERLMQGTTRPPTMPAMSPETGGTPQATAMPRQRGSATRKTTMPATRSCRG